MMFFQSFKKRAFYALIIITTGWLLFSLRQDTSLNPKLKAHKFLENVFSNLVKVNSTICSSNTDNGGKKRQNDSSMESSRLLLQQIPSAFRKFIPENITDVSEYVKVPAADLTDFGDFRSFRTPKSLADIMEMCNDLNASCKAFVFDARETESLVYIKNMLALPSTSSSKNNLYIKKTYLESFLQVLSFRSKCSLTNLTGADRNTCQLPKIDPWAKEIEVLLKKPHPSKKCNDKLVYTELKNGMLRLRDDRKNDSNFLYALAEPIIRGHRDNDISLGPPRNVNLQNQSFKIDSDFWKVTTYLKDKKNINYHLTVIEKPEVLKRKLPKDALLDIYILAFDGTSEAHFRRMLPKSYAFLKDDLKGFMFKGFATAGDNTLPNMNAMLTGIPLKENRKIQALNDWPLMYKYVREKGFATMFSEDNPGLGAFILTLPGFFEQPTDHYARPFWREAPMGPCIGGQFQPKLQFDYLKSFMKSYKGRRKFAHVHLTDVCHRGGDMNFISIAEEALLSFLKSLKEEKLLNQSMFLVMGDHGWRYGQFRRTYQGKLEQRLPMLSVVLPQWFQQKYPRRTANFRKSTKLITSPFDLHATFMHLMEFPHYSSKGDEQGSSLFDILPDDRICSDAGIPDLWCPCIEWHQIDHTHAQIKTAAEKIVDWMNRDLDRNHLSREMCSKMKLNKVVKALQRVPKYTETNNDKKMERCSYEIQLETLPGNALFEVPVDVLSTGEYKVYEISRINAYGTQAQCIETIVPSVRKYCYCI